MHVTIIIGGALVATGTLLWLHHKLTEKRASEETSRPEPVADATSSDSGEECCGMHITCERDSLTPVFAEKPEYFDDEELDAYAGRPADCYTEAETEQFRDVLFTLRPDDIALWSRSVQLRGINLPEAVREELLMIVAEERQRRSIS